MSIINDFLLNLPLPLIDHWGYLILFFSAVVETLPVLGTFIPGHAVVFFSGFLAYAGIFRLDAAIAVAFAGALTGDLLAYIIGRKYGHDFMVRYGKYFFLNQERLEKTKRMVLEHAGKTLIIGRFGAFTRAVSAFIAGASKVKFFRFIFFAVAGGAAWASSSVLVGYIFGQGFAVAAKYFGRFIVIAIVAIILIILGYRLLDKRRHIFVKYHVYYLTLNALPIYVFSKMVEDYFDKESTYRFDLWLNQNIHLIWQPWLNKLMILISAVLSPEVLFTVALVAAVYFFIKRKRYQASLIFMSTAGGLVLGAITKWLVNRPRPLGGLIQETGLSFPSQHSLMALIFFSLVLFIFAEKIKNQWLRNLFIAGDIFLIILVGFSRIYLKVHWFSDALAGFALGLFWLTFLILVFRIIVSLIKRNNPE
ncbi:MAG: Phosphoesterase PA-phosphatase related protein [Parcubacteria group bacterium GW2011_GWC2_42_12]|nr:MAG: Phosphoesterase PA-phosphatase related protein [Parcubacteria group bacterium GW2011_GWC2_42_12]